MSERNHYRKRHEPPPDRAERVLRMPRRRETALAREAGELMRGGAAARAAGLRVVAIAVLPAPRLILAGV